RALNSAELIAFDVETTGLNKISDTVVGICLAVESPHAYYIPIAHILNEAQAEQGQMSLFAAEPELAPDQLPLATVLDAIRPAMSNPAIGKVAHNAKFDYVILQRAGLTVTPITFDTMLAEWLTDPTSKHLGLKDLARHRLGIEMQPISDLIGTGKKARPFSEVDIDAAAPYGAADADMTLRLVEPLQAELAQKNIEHLLELELQVMPVLAAMEQAGVAIDVPFFENFSAELEQRTAALRSEIHEIAGHEFNINSTQQLSNILFTELNLPHERLKKTRSGHYSTASSVLQNLRMVDDFGIIDKIIEYREVGKLRSTYVEALPQQVNPTTGRIHTNFRQTGAVTGRLASNNPNLQNIPIRTELGRKIRRGFVARAGWQFVSADYSQVELRILAHVSGDETLLKAFHDGEDIHRLTASQVNGIVLEEVTFEQRRQAKAVNFGLMYGMGPYRLANDNDMTLAEAENYIKAYFERFPGVRAYLDNTKKRAAEDGYVETLIGRRRYFPIFQQGSRANQRFIAQAERVAVNHPIQGTAADIIKVAMIRLHKALLANYRARILLQVHDELIIEAPDDEVEAVKALLIETMSNAFKLDVPLKV
ncbi:MAG TPA: DNA polymerase I, partial [Anaerolineae bacterium]|nr:DNA polymerase I [Anaerolineae bacterium]